MGNLEYIEVHIFKAPRSCICWITQGIMSRKIQDSRSGPRGCGLCLQVLGVDSTQLQPHLKVQCPLLSLLHGDRMLVPSMHFCDPGKHSGS